MSCSYYDYVVLVYSALKTRVRTANAASTRELKFQKMEVEEQAAVDTLYTLDGVTLMMDSESRGEGKLVLTSSNVTWIPKADGLRSESWAYQEIVMHAVSPATSTAPACIYCHLDGEDVTEVRFCPPDEGHLDEMFYSFNKGAELNPDALGAEEQEEEATGEVSPFYFNAQEFGVENDPNVRMHGSGLGMMSPEDFMTMITSQGIEVYENEEEQYEEGEGEENDEEMGDNQSQ